MAQKRTANTLIPREAEATRKQLVVVAGAHVGRVYPLSARATIGRAPDAGIILGDPDVSRIHGVIFHENGAWWVEDAGSRNGTFVNGTRQERARLSTGDMLRLGQNVVLQLVDSDPVEAELIERQRFEAVGRLSLGIAHDFNNMLAALTATIDYLASTSFCDLREAELEECLSDMGSATRRATRLAAKLLRAGKRAGDEMTRVDLSKLCIEVAQLVCHTLPRSISVHTEIAPRLRVLGDPVSLHQVLMNLIINARDAMPSGGRITLTVRAMQDPQRSEARQVVLAVQDTGVGMEEATLRRIFEPHFTTKTEGVGFGLGLATVKELVQRHGGRIDVRSHPGKGTTFWITLPAAARHPHIVTASTVNERFQVVPETSQGTRVLLVDDEIVLRRTYRRVLRQNGCVVEEAGNGREALDRFDVFRPQVVLLDVDMPVMDGIAACEAMRARAPAIPVVFVTGYDDPDLRHRLVELGASGVLIKPVATDELIATVATALQLAESYDDATAATLG